MATAAGSSRSRRNRGSSWSLSATVRVAALAVAAFTPGRSQVVTKDNGDLVDRSGLMMSTTLGPRTFSVEINRLPLINRSERSASIVDTDLVLYTVDTERRFRPEDLAFINCDTSNGNNATATFLRAIAQDPKPCGVIFYTVEHDWCDYSGSGSFDAIYTTLDKEQANDFQQLLLNSTDGLEVTISYNNTVDEEPAEGQGDDQNAGQNSNVLGPTPSTSVALIILYSITGVITALFLLIIMIGAVRAHRHPERYGPRATARFGRPRQSRAKGLARAVLDTLPIVRFGDTPAPGPQEEPVKPTDMEMQTDSITSRTSGENNDERRSAVPSVEPQAPDGVGITAAPVVAVSDGEEQVMSTAEMDPSQLRCPVCMEDFESGQDLRVLPCHHSFHPDCIDPWLLNVAGSCPLCRIDLRPEDQRQSLELPPPPPEPEYTGSRFMRYLDIARGTTGEERMAALRQLREESRANAARPRSRAPELGISRLRRVFHRRMSSSRASQASAGEGSSGATGSTRSVSGGAGAARGGDSLTTINSLEIRGRANVENASGSASDQHQQR